MLPPAHPPPPIPSTSRERVVALIELRGAHGATDEELHRILNLDPSTERPRRRELQLAGLVVDSGRQRKTASGRKATVWIVPGAREPCTASKATLDGLCTVCLTQLTGRQEAFCSRQCRMVWNGRRASR